MKIAAARDRIVIGPPICISRLSRKSVLTASPRLGKIALAIRRGSLSATRVRWTNLIKGVSNLSKTKKLTFVTIPSSRKKR